ncbi:Uncharacterised protein [Mycobacteroides abscessus subsp. abscessus]|nr:Uncharacterised protein [Mycobacteroides abscessus subsp. abscessus]
MSLDLENPTRELPLADQEFLDLSGKIALEIREFRA